MRIKFPKCVSVCTKTGDLILECPDNLVVQIMDRGVPGVIGPTFDLNVGEIITNVIKRQLEDSRLCNWTGFNSHEWKFEVSSGYNGYRSKKTGVWIYESDYKRLCKGEAVGD